MQKKIPEKCFVFEIIESELGVANSRNIERDTCHRCSICQQTPLRFRLTLEEIFSKSTSFRMMKKHDKIALMKVFTSIWDNFTC